jgi:hypothetical protein
VALLALSVALFLTLEIWIKVNAMLNGDVNMPGIYPWEPLLALISWVVFLYLALNP